MRREPLLLLLLQLLSVLNQPADAQVCPSGRAISNRRFGFTKSAGQGVNESYVYLVFVQDVTSNSGPLECSGTASLSAMQRLEAGLWAASTFRSRYPGVLSGVTVGSLVLDACQSALMPAQLLGNLQSCETVFGSDTSTLVEPRNVAAFVGVESMDEAVNAFSVTTSFSRPAVTYSLASSSLRRSAYPLVARVTPSDLTELDALVQTLLRLGVQHVQVVHSDASVQAGRFVTLADSAQTRLASAGICVVNRVPFSSTAASSVNAFWRIRPVLLLVTRSDLMSFASQMLALRPSSGTFTWLLLAEHWDSVGSIVAGKENFFSGALAVEVSTTANYSDYLAYFRGLRPDMAEYPKKNPWLADFWSAHFACNLPGSASSTYPTICNYASNNLQSIASVKASVYRVIQSVDLSLHALELIRRDLCLSGDVSLCSAFRSNANRYRLSYDKLFQAASLGYTDVALDPTTGAASKYSLFVNNYQKGYPGHAWTRVAAYASGSFSLTAQPQAYGTDERNVTWAPSGLCDSPCLARCPSNDTSTISPPTTVGSTTVGGSAATTNSSLLLQTRYRMQYWVYALIVCASVGIIVTLLFMIYILFKVLSLPSELKSFNTLWSGQFLLFFILVGYVFLFAWVPWPSVESCGTIRFMLGFAYAAVFSILMVKLLNLMNDQLKPVYQLLMFALALCIQIAINVEWLILVPITTPVVDGMHRCGHTFEQHLQSLVYCMALILLCTCLAIRAHSIGRNNRESIFVGCTAGISIPIWIAWCLVGSLNDDIEVKDASQAFGLFVNLTLVLLVVFLPKIHQLRRLEDAKEAPDDVAVDVIDDMYDLEDAYAKEPIYMLTQGAPSVVSETAGLGQVYQLASPDGLALPSPAGYARARSLQGDPIVLPLSPGINGSGGGPRSVILGTRTPRKAYSDYNPSGASPRAPLDRTDGGAAAAAGVNSKGTKTERLAKLGFL
ncbi:hypothetical protein BOX15_Mlig000487g3 [Macrostomum lignano]|uniref:Uncharacterized protein n=2 Tax=Macrostomum lignano TaxID=282301 RepID=A0A267E3R7_9PLAT|nr:hypothetical protein BOX15_Mlig000487g3 [Macrostomum lignano]